MPSRETEVNGLRGKRWRVRRIGRATVAWRVCVVLAMGGTLLSACGTGSAGPTAMVQKYLAAWSKGDYGAMSALVSDPPSNFVTFNRQVASDLGLTKATHDLGTVSTDGSTGTADVTSHMTLGSLGTVRVRSHLTLTDASGSWKVKWSPRSIIPSLGTGDSVSTNLSWPARAPILGMGGVSLTTSVPMVSVGIEGSRVTDGAALLAALTQVGHPASQVKAAELTAMAHPTWFVPVISLTQARVRAGQAGHLPGAGHRLQRHTAPRGALTPELGAHVVGTIGPITAQELNTGPAVRRGGHGGPERDRAGVRAPTGRHTRTPRSP